MNLFEMVKFLAGGHAPMVTFSIRDWIYVCLCEWHVALPSALLCFAAGFLVGWREKKR